MAMSLAALEILEEAQFPPAQARAIARVLEADLAARREDLATRADLAELRQATKGDLAGLWRATKADLTELRQATTADIAALRADIAEERQAVKADVAELRSAVKADIAELHSAGKTDIAEMRQGVNADIARLEVKIESAKFEGVRWTFLMMMGQVTMLAGIMYFLLQNSR